MTIDGAINWLQRGLFAPEGTMTTEELSCIAEAYDMAITALRAQQEAEKNEPLTLKEIIEMDGEPVWTVDHFGAGGWCLVDINNGALDLSGEWLPGNEYGKEGLEGWIAYRHPPKEANDGANT